MGDYRITIEAIGGHGCGRNANDGDAVTRCGQPHCPDCKAVAFVKELGTSGNSIQKATLEHWPFLNTDKTERRPIQQAGPIDDLVSGIRRGKF